MAKKENSSNSFDDMFFAPKPVTVKPPIRAEEPKTIVVDKKNEESKNTPVIANKRGRKANTASTERSEGKKTVTVYLNAENWAQFCLIATLRKPSASAWLDELIIEEIRKNQDVLDLVNSIK